MSPDRTSFELAISGFPETLGSFLALRDQIAATPEGGAVMILVALTTLAQEGTDAYGRRALTVALDRSRLVSDADGYQGWSPTVRDVRHLERQVVGRPWLLWSYVLGTSPAQGYRLPAPPYRFEISRNPYSGEDAVGQVKVFVTSTGAATPRPVTLRRNTRDVWKAYEWSSLTVGVRPPTSEVFDDRL